MASRSPHRATVLLAAILLGGTAMAAAAQEAQPPAAALPDRAVCAAAAAAAEHRHGIPAGLLNAIGRVESGRRDPASGRMEAWPWAINAEGRGQLFDAAATALSGTRALQAGGTASIDVGCFQVNLVHHRNAFATLEEAFDPAQNADYAGRFLSGLREKTGSWEQAVANYHSATPERGGPYRDRVLATWQGTPEALAASGAPAPAPVRAPGPVVIRMVSWTPASGAPAAGGMRIWTPSAPGQGAAVIAMPRASRG